MATVDALLRRVQSMRALVDQGGVPRQWNMVLEEGEALADDLRNRLGVHDRLSIRRFPRGYMPERNPRGQTMSCWLNGRRGRQIPHVVYEKET